MTANKEWSQLRSNLLEKIWQLITSWDGTAEHALIITEMNQENIVRWQKMEKQTGNQEFLPYTEVEKEKQTEILRHQREIMASIQEERTMVISQMKQLNQKNKVRDNYVSIKPDSFFIDKGL